MLEWLHEFFSCFDIRSVLCDVLNLPRTMIVGCINKIWRIQMHARVIYGFFEVIVTKVADVSNGYSYIIC